MLDRSHEIAYVLRAIGVLFALCCALVAISLLVGRLLPAQPQVRVLVTSSTDELAIRRIDIRTGATMTHYPRARRPSRFAPNGEYRVLTIRDDASDTVTLRLRHLPDARERVLAQYPRSQRPRFSRFFWSLDSQMVWVVLADEDNHALLHGYTVATGARTAVHATDFTVVNWLQSNGDWVLLRNVCRCSFNNAYWYVSLLNLATGDQRIYRTAPSTAHQFSPDGQWVAYVVVTAADSAQIQVEHLASDRRYTIAIDTAVTFSWSPDSRYVLYDALDRPAQLPMTVIDMRDGTSYALTGIQQGALAWAGAGDHLLVRTGRATSDHYLVHLSQQTITRLPDLPIVGWALAPQGDYLAYDTRAGAVRIYDIARQQFRTIPYRARAGERINAVDWYVPVS